jgi:pimeloyl-ACP methyl ester carboxylesterase
MKETRRMRFVPTTLAGLAALALAGCAVITPATPRMATGKTPAMACEALAARFAHPNTRVLSTEAVAAGTLRLPGIAEPMPEHCVVKGAMHERTSTIDGKRYAIGFEMRLPTAWNGRFFYQANGGLDGFITPAYGDILGGGQASNGLLKGFAVISSDAGHAFDRSTPIGGATFGLDPQARLDYGYNAVAQLTPMAKSLIAAYYGKGPDTSYFVGSSNGGRHGFVTASRLPDQYDGVLVSTPGYRLPLAAAAQLWDAQQFATIAKPNAATSRPDLSTALPPAAMNVVARSILARCDALDGLADGIVSDLRGCQGAFQVERDIPTCTADGAGAQCLSPAQKGVIARVLAGPQLRNGTPVYAGLPADPGLAGRDWASWKFVNSVGPRDAIAMAFVFSTPPASTSVVTGEGNSLVDYVLAWDMEREATRLTTAMEFMAPPDPLMRRFIGRGGKMIVFHGAADPVFSALDSIRWYEALGQAHGAAAAAQARLYLVPGMNHSRGGPATDQVDMLDPLVRWVEGGQAPGEMIARARGATAAVPNPEVPADWAPDRTRPLCPYPQVARYRGAGNVETAASFACL